MVVGGVGPGPVKTISLFLGREKVMKLWAAEVMGQSCLRRSNVAGF